MSMSTHVVFLRSADDPTYQKYLKIYRACEEAGLVAPPEVTSYFEDGEEGPLEVRCYPREWNDDMQQGYEIDVSDIPEGVKIIRFWNSW